MAGAQVVPAQTPFSHFGYCSPPVPPACVAELEPARPPSPSCKGEVESYVALVFKYRVCLAAEMERAVREANVTIEAIRCAIDRAACSSPSDPQGPPPPATDPTPATPAPLRPTQR